MSESEQKPEGESEAIEIEYTINPEEFDAPRKLMWDELVNEFGKEAVAESIEASVAEQGLVFNMARSVVTGLYDSREELREQGFGEVE